MLIDKIFIEKCSYTEEYAQKKMKTQSQLGTAKIAFIPKTDEQTE